MPIHKPAHEPVTLSNHPPSPLVNDGHRAPRASVAPLATDVRHASNKHGQRPVALMVGLVCGALAAYAALPWLGWQGSAATGVSVVEPAMTTSPVAQEVPPPLTPTSRPHTEVPAPEALAPDTEPPFALDFDEGSAREALRHRAKTASACPEVRKGGKVPVSVTFSPAGVSTAAHVSSKGLTGTNSGRCVEAKLLGVTIPAFRGKERTVTLSVTL